MGAWLSRAVAAETPSTDLAAGSEVADVEEATLTLVVTEAALRLRVF